MATCRGALRLLCDRRVRASATCARRWSAMRAADSTAALFAATVACAESTAALCAFAAATIWSN